MKDLEQLLEGLSEDDLITLQSYTANKIISLFEMSHTRQKVESKISDKADIILKHLIKVMWWKDDINFNKHVHDINNWLYEIQRLKPKSGVISEMDYYNWLFNEIVDSQEDISNMIRLDLKGYSKLPRLHPDDSIFTLYSKLKDVYSSLAKSLANKSFKHIEDVIDKILINY